MVQKDSFDVTANQMKSMEGEIDKLTEEIRKLHEIGELEKKTNAQLEIQIGELKEKLNSKQVQKDLEVNVEIAELNNKIRELQKALDEVEKSYHKKMEDSKREQGRQANDFIG